MQEAATQPAPSTAALIAAAAEPLETGSTAPDFDLPRLDAKPAKLADYQRKPLLIVFGSFSCPTFRQNAAALNELKKTHGRKANLLVIYTREAHAVGEWEVERNRDEDLRVDQPATAEQRLRIAKTMQAGLKLVLDVAVDSIDDSTTRAYHAFPNGAVLLDGDRKVVATLRWAEPHALARLIDQADKERK